MRKPRTIDAYLATLEDDDQRAALAKLRQTIKSIVPDAEEYIGYGMPGFKYHGRPLVYFAAAKNHCALYGAAVAAFQEDLSGYDTSKGTIRFQPDKPLPVSLVRKLLKSRIAAGAARRKA